MQTSTRTQIEPQEQPEWVTLAGGEFTMGSDDFYPDEAPERCAEVDGFELGRTPVTNRQFTRFVEDSGYVTVAEQQIPQFDLQQIAGTDPAPGSLVFTPTQGPVDLQDWRQWWRWVPGASWKWPRGVSTGLTAQALAEHPVVHIAYADAVAYAEWVGGRLPTETELEFAACGGSKPAPYAWGASRDLDGRIMANTWRGDFPYRNVGARGWIGTSPVATFPQNGYGLLDCIGNVWEWTSTRYEAAPSTSACQCSPQTVAQPTSSMHGGGSAELRDPLGPAAGSPLPLERVLKGGSHLCAPEYCLRYRPAARSSQAETSATSHIGFRVARDLS